MPGPEGLHCPAAAAHPHWHRGSRLLLRNPKHHLTSKSGSPVGQGAAGPRELADTLPLKGISSRRAVAAAAETASPEPVLLLVFFKMMLPQSGTAVATAVPCCELLLLPPPFFNLPSVRDEIHRFLSSLLFSSLVFCLEGIFPSHGGFSPPASLGFAGLEGRVHDESGVLANKSFCLAQGQQRWLLCIR